MSSRYDDTRSDSSRRDRVANDREPGEGIRQSSQNIRNAGGDIVSNICGLWGNLFSSLSDAVSPQSSSYRSGSASSRENAGERYSGFSGCEGAEFRISCSAPRSGTEYQDESQDQPGDRDRPTKARYADGKREIDVTT
jgi:hypothetical protein